MTFSVSPFATSLSPPVKSPSENRTPDVPDATVAKNAPATVVVLLILKTAGPTMWWAIHCL